MMDIAKSALILAAGASSILWAPYAVSFALWSIVPEPTACFGRTKFLDVVEMPRACFDWRHCGTKEENLAKGYACTAKEIE